MKALEEVLADIEEMIRRKSCAHFKDCTLCPLTDYRAATRVHNLSECCRPEGGGWNGWPLRRATIEELVKMKESLQGGSV